MGKALDSLEMHRIHIIRKMCLVSFFASSFFRVKEASKLASALYLYGIVWSVFTRAERGVMIRSVIVRFCFGFDC